MTQERKVAFITGLARGQGRAHAVRLAQDGWDVAGIDICENIASMDYPNASEEDLAQTVNLVEEQGARIVAGKGDTRSRGDLQRVLDDAMAEFGRVDALIANAGIAIFRPDGDRDQIWDDVISVNLTGPWKAVETVLPAIRAGGRGGSIVITSSVAGLKGTGSAKAGPQAYHAAKRGLVGLMQVLANEYAKEKIRVNTIHPTGVISGMTQNPAMFAMQAAARAGGKNDISEMQNLLPYEILNPEDIANAVAYLVSDAAHFITGIQFPLDAGFAVK